MQTTIQDVEKAIPVLKSVTKVVSEVEKITLPIIEDVVIGVTDTTETTLTKVVEGVDKTVNTLPTVPVCHTNFYNNHPYVKWSSIRS